MNPFPWLSSVMHGGCISGHDQALTLLWGWDGGDRHMCELTQYSALRAEMEMHTECKDGVVHSLQNSAWGSR